MGPVVMTDLRPARRPAEATDNTPVWLAVPREGADAHRLDGRHGRETRCGLDAVEHGQMLPAGQAVIRHQVAWDCRECWGADPYPYPEHRQVPPPPPELERWPLPLEESP